MIKNKNLLRNKSKIRCIVVKDKETNDTLMLTYFSFINGKYLKSALECFTEKKGYGQEIVFISFQSDLDDYDMAQLPKPLGDKHVLLELSYPTVEINQIVYLDFETFYKYLDEYIKKTEKNPDESELMDLLIKVKSSLCV